VSRRHSTGGEKTGVAQRAVEHVYRSVQLILALLLLPSLALAQAPLIGVIDFYGLREVSEDRVRELLGTAEGGELPDSRIDAEEAIQQISGVVRARLEAICCDDEGQAILYVGIEERGAPHFEVREPPTGIVLLPESVHESYAGFLAAVNVAVREGNVAEDLTNGHSLMANVDCRGHQEEFLEFAAENAELLRDVLRNSFNEEHRAMAAYIIGYATDKTEVVGDLLYSLRDGDEPVRNNAMRALAAIEVLAKRRPTLNIEIPPTWLVEMLNSLIWTDRTAAAANLVNLTEWREERVLDQLRSRAIEALIDMAGWQQLQHALPAFILLGRAVGMEEEQIQQAWFEGEREAVLARGRELMAELTKQR